MGQAGPHGMIKAGVPDDEVLAMLAQQRQQPQGPHPSQMDAILTRVLRDEKRFRLIRRAVGEGVLDPTPRLTLSNGRAAWTRTCSSRATARRSSTRRRRSTGTWRWPAF
jgi:hypothetical protein